MYWDPVFNTYVQAVPYERILRHYRSVDKLRELLNSESRDELEELAVSLARLISSEANISTSCIGVSGSILVGLHSIQSDIDLIIVGEKNSRKAYDALSSLMEESIHVRRYTIEELKRLYRFRLRDTLMSFEDFIRIERRKVLQGIFGGRDFYIRLVKTHEEYGEKYGDKIYVPLGKQEIRAQIVDASDSIFTPCRYVVEVRDVLRGPKDIKVEEITSFRGRFCEQALEGEEVIARGKLEKVISEEKIYYRLLLGGERDHYMILS